MPDYSNAAIDLTSVDYWVKYPLEELPIECIVNQYLLHVKLVDASAPEVEQEGDLILIGRVIFRLL